ncbi:MAG: hypothetical protein M1832_001940 [Thelocarpon impressellum]|nr:MAG: hypothetical protein M1832_001940 [Thelocarpon impressellum]
MELARDVPVKAESYLNAGERLGHRLLIWEPVPDLCTPAELENCFEAIRGVHVVSPNHDELAGFFGSSGVVAETGDVDLGLVEQWCRVLLDRGIGVDGKGAVVVRAGKSGCYTATREMSRWLPAFHQDPFKVVDPTGGGNAFLGGLAVGLVRTQSLEEAVIWGTVAASFAIEQVGMPELGSDARGETWNGARVRERLEQFRTRL